MSRIDPELIRQIYDAEEAATAAESRQTQQDIATDPDLARAMLQSTFALKTQDVAFEMLYRRATDAILEELILERAADDTFALRAAAIVRREMDAMAESSARERVARGKPKKARSA